MKTSHFTHIYAILLLTLTAIPITAVAATFVVNSTIDFIDINIGDGLCADILGDCTLRAAISEANQTAAFDTINFNLSPGPTFYQIDILSTEMPEIIHPLEIRGDSQPGYAGTPIIAVVAYNRGDGIATQSGNGNRWLFSTFNNNLGLAVDLIKYQWNRHQ